MAHLVDAEYDDKYNRKLSRLIKNAGFKQQVSLEHIDYHHPRNIDRNLILRLQSCDWINKGRDFYETAMHPILNIIPNVLLKSFAG
ncbi:MAG: ATP-binding protein [Bacteroidales bacterium]|nr:ATP-binding protein [Bacteroidales bacterium]